MPDVPERCPMCGAPKRRQLLVGNYYVESNAIEYDCDTMLIEGSEASESTNCLRRQRDAARAEAERLTAENERLYRRIERLEARAARQRVMLYRLQAAVERRNREERIEALRRAVYDETVERYMRECDAADDEAERWRARYEALRAGVERVIQDLRASFRLAFSTASPYHDGASEAYYKAEQMVRRVLDEEGGDKRD